AGTPCFLVLSPMPAVATNLGAPGCDAWFWIGAGALLGQPTARPDWSLQVPVPNVRQLVGLEIALQAYYVGTASPLGYDLTNGLWARLGY
ncbi:MAG: hypothetical protein KDC48_12425, partial [Planctomycetes bacterium]|nr:hypothetical protein [Planctomycetota bacterium]